MIANSSICHWESVPLKVTGSNNGTAIEMGIFHPRLMGVKEFDSVKLEF